MAAKSFWHNDYLDLVIRLFLGVVFIYASIDKIAAPQEFARIINNYHILPAGFINLTALFLPWLEIICGLFLVFGIYKDGAEVLINIMLVVFMFAIGINLIRGVDLECGCFTVSSHAKEGAFQLLLRDIGMLIMGIYLMINRSYRFDLVKPKNQ